LDSFEQTDCAAGIARAHSILGMCYWHKHEDDRARDHTLESVRRFGDIRDAASQAEALNHLGIVCRSLTMYDEALEALNAAEHIYQQFRDNQGLGKCVNSMGTAYWWRGDIPNAVKCYARASRINKRIRQQYVCGLTANNLGYLLLQTSTPARALKAFRQARVIRRQSKLKNYEMMDLSGMALAYLHLNRPEAARRASRAALKGLEGTEAVEDIERAYLNHYLIFRSGDAADRQEARTALSTAKDLVEKRMERIRDTALRARFRVAHPIAREVLACAADVTDL
jgi:tetratricopeptide (TPR) repeat protein